MLNDDQAMFREEVFFEKAVPVWQPGKENEKNWSLVFRTVVPAAHDTLLRIAGHTRFMIYVNGTFLAAGPARAGHGWYRVDEYPLDTLLTEKENVVAILVAGYAINSFAYLDKPSFLCCEVLQGGKPAAATGIKELPYAFETIEYTQRVQKVQRYSFQRTFVEDYFLASGWDSFFKNPEDSTPRVTVTATEAKRFLPRYVPYTVYQREYATQSVQRGSLIYREEVARPGDLRALEMIGPKIKGYREEELQEQTGATAQHWVADGADKSAIPGADANLAADGYTVFAFEKELTGFLQLTVTALQDTTLIAVFDEVFNGEKVDINRMGCSNTVIWHLEGGVSYDLLAFEPYSLKYLQIGAVGGGVQLRGVSLRRYDFPALAVTNLRKMPTERLQKIYNAAVETFRQNTLDIYMDCPSRERGGWLCDSFFTSRVEYALTGKSTVERCFLQNFLLPESFEFLPKGMLPMCYPSDHNDGVFIPNWAMWFVLELEEYADRSGDFALVAAAKQRVYELMDYFRGYENPDGLLEKLDSWVFLEWSRSNELIQDINYPTNMLYARTKEAVAKLYGDEQLQAEALTLKQVIRQQAFMGDFFCDNAVYGEDGVARISGEATESCQYYAFFTGTATPAEYPELWRTLVQEFGPDRAEKGRYPQVAAANAFIGNYLRLDILYRYGEFDKVLVNIDGYFYYMAEKTGTLWEDVSDHASCNHGFASHVLYWLHGIFAK